MAVNILAFGRFPKLLIEYASIWATLTRLSRRALLFVETYLNGYPLRLIIQCNFFVCEYLEKNLYCIVVFNVSVINKRF